MAPTSHEKAAFNKNTPKKINNNILNKKFDPGIPRVGFSYIFAPGCKKFAFFDLRFGFLMRNCVYSHLGP